MDIQVQVDALKAAIRDVPDFPKKGIVFKDITTLLKDPALFRRTIDLLAVLCGERTVDKVVAIESRGFILGGPIAQRLEDGLVTVRKPRKLPAKTLRREYAIEYGTDALEIHADACFQPAKVLVVDDVLATGGTARAVGDLVDRLGARVAAYAFLVELTFLNGREKLPGREVLSLIRY